MTDVLWLLLIPIIWAAAAHLIFKNTITIKEAAVKGGGAAFIILIAYSVMFWSNVHDTEILNGAVTGKKQEWVSCEHDYDCNCTTDKDGHRSCDTCYEHSHDYDWNVFTNVGTITIDRIDRQGTDEPPRWTAVLIGEPVAVEHSYINYLRAAPNSLFNMELAEQEAKSHAAIIPSYPHVYDYYRIKHAIDVNAGITNLTEWDAHIDSILRKLGHDKQVNINVIFVKGVDRSYRQTLERAWLGGKKNDVTIMVGVDGTAIQWVEAFTFGKTSGNAMLAVALRDELQAIGTTAEPGRAAATINAVILKHFKRKPMSDYEYLAGEGGPSATAIGWLIGIILLLLAGATWYFHHDDPFHDGMSSSFGNRIRLRQLRIYRR